MIYLGATTKKEMYLKIKIILKWLTDVMASNPEKSIFKW